MTDLQEMVAGIDVYLLDQILKGRYAPGEHILEVGAGGGRNLKWFLHEGMHVTAVDSDPRAVQHAKAVYANYQFVYLVANGNALPFENESFQHIVSSAVLHFSATHADFALQFAELVRVLKPGGTLFIRTATNIGMENLMINESGRSRLPDGSERYLLTLEKLAAYQLMNNLILLEPIKSVVVARQRSMGVVVFGKGNQALYPDK